MHAMVLNKIGEALEWTELPDRQPGPGQIRVAIAACGLLWEERQLLSVANLTRQDGRDFLGLAPGIGIVTKTTRYPLREANQALANLHAGRFEGVAVPMR